MRKDRLQRFKKITAILFICSIFFTVHCTLLTVNSFAEIPHLINYQGRLTDSQGKTITGTVNVTFRIYDVESGGSPLWDETYTSLTIDKGLFNIMLGGGTDLNLPFDKPYYLGIQVGSDPEMTPRQRLSSAAYAFTAENGVPKGAIVMWSGSIADIPTGWALCDGSNGTPNLRDRFIVGAKQDDGGIAKTNITGSLTQSGGSTAISISNLPPHTHDVGSYLIGSSGAHTHKAYGCLGGTGMTYGLSLMQGTGGYWHQYTLIDTAGGHSHNISGASGPVGSGIPYAQPYYALCFIIKIT